MTTRAMAPELTRPLAPHICRHRQATLNRRHLDRMASLPLTCLLRPPILRRLGLMAPLAQLVHVLLTPMRLHSLSDLMELLKQRF